MEAVGATASIIGILDAASQAMSHLFALVGEYRHVHESITLLLSHLTPLRTALG